MVGYNSTEHTQRIVDANVCIIASCFNQDIVDKLLDACIKTLIEAGLQDQNITVIRVPGAFELPVTAQHIIRHTESGYDAVIALGAIIRGETPHFDYIAAHCAHGLGQVSIANDIPVIFGVLTVDTKQQAMNRAGDGNNNKGIAIAHATIEMIHLFKQVPYK